MSGHIKIHGPFPPPTGIVGPYASTTESYVYQIFNQQGRKLIGGTYGPDRDALVAFARRLATQKGMADPTIEFITPNEAK